MPTNAVSVRISLPRLERLAHFYQVPVDQLLPRGDESLGADETGAVR